MRQLKQMMRARKAQMLWCGPCECITLKCWRENDAYCNCGDEWSQPTPPAPTTHTVKFQSNNNSYGTVNTRSIEVEDGATVDIVENVLVIGEYTVTAIAEAGYRFARRHVRWGWEMPVTITSDLTIVAQFEEYIPIQWIDAPSQASIMIIEGPADESITFTYSPADATHVIADVQITSSDPEVATAIISNASNGVATLRIYWVGHWQAIITYFYELASYEIEVNVSPAP